MEGECKLRDEERTEKRIAFRTATLRTKERLRSVLSRFTWAKDQTEAQQSQSVLFTFRGKDA